MRCHHVQELFSEIYDGVAAAQTALVKHIQECPVCMAEYEDYGRLIDEIRQLPAPELPTDFHKTVMAKVRAAALTENISLKIPQKRTSQQAYAAARRWAGVAAAACLLLVSLWAVQAFDIALPGAQADQAVESADIAPRLYYPVEIAPMYDSPEDEFLIEHDLYERNGASWTYPYDMPVGASAPPEAQAAADEGSAYADALPEVHVDLQELEHDDIADEPEEWLARGVDEEPGIIPIVPIASDISIFGIYGTLEDSDDLDQDSLDPDSNFELGLATGRVTHVQETSRSWNIALILGLTTLVISVAAMLACIFRARKASNIAHTNEKSREVD